MMIVVLRVLLIVPFVLKFLDIFLYPANWIPQVFQFVIDIHWGIKFIYFVIPAIWLEKIAIFRKAGFINTSNSEFSYITFWGLLFLYGGSLFLTFLIPFILSIKLKE